MAFDPCHMLSEDGPIARRLGRFEARPPQLRMTEAVVEALAKKERLLVEAGTGVGKSFAYLLPAIQRIVEHDERIVIATNTINLQEQLLEKDIPLLNAVIPDEFSAVLVKGRNNYVSLRRLKLASERQDRLLGDDEERHALHAIEDWAYGTTDGTLSTLPQISRMSVWDHVRSDSHNCMGKKCDSYDRCFYQRARRRMENGDLLICNHAIFFADLALRAQGVGFLPPYDHVILDEAHGIEDVAAEHFGLSLSETRAKHLLRVLHHPRKHRGFLSTLELRDGGRELIDKVINRVIDCQDETLRFFDALESWKQRQGPRNGRIAEADVVTNTLAAPFAELSRLLKLLRDRAKRPADEYELNSYAARAAEVAQTAAMLIEQQIEGCVYWIEGADDDDEHSRARPRTSRRFRRMALKCMAVEVGPILNEHLYRRDVGIILTSATLATAPDDFSHATRRLGLEEARTLQLGSPFDYARQMRVVVDRSMPSPEQPSFNRELGPRILEHVRDTNGGAFVLFTSYAALDAVARHLAPQLREEGFPVQVQGQDGPPTLLLNRFREDPRSVLFGTVRFWQGVDVRGEGLRNVIITRLPFAVPDLPLIQARHERIKERGGNPFVDDQVPNAVIRFKQGIGRLIRSADDTGRIVILDPRVVTKFYGKRFLAALPEGVAIDIRTGFDEEITIAPDEF